MTEKNDLLIIQSFINNQIDDNKIKLENNENQEILNI